MLETSVAICMIGELYYPVAICIIRMCLVFYLSPFISTATTTQSHAHPSLGFHFIRIAHPFASCITPFVPTHAQPSAQNIPRKSHRSVAHKQITSVTICQLINQGISIQSARYHSHPHNYFQPPITVTQSTSHAQTSRLQAQIETLQFFINRVTRKLAS